MTAQAYSKKRDNTSLDKVKIMGLQIKSRCAIATIIIYCQALFSGPSGRWSGQTTAAGVDLPCRRSSFSGGN